MFRWNSKKYEKRYSYISELAQNNLMFKIKPEELEYTFLDKLTKKTKSYRISRLITLAYYLGQLRAIKDLDQLESIVTLQNQEIGGIESVIESSSEE